MAKNNIENYFSVVGVQERYEDTVQMARATFEVNLSAFHVNNLFVLILIVVQDSDVILEVLKHAGHLVGHLMQVQTFR